MRANISEELMDKIEDSIYLSIEVHMYSNKLEKAIKEGNDTLARFFEQVIKEIISERKEVNDFLKQNGIKIYDPESDEMFVKYHYSQKVNGGYKEGIFQIWKAAIKLKLKKRMSKYFYNGGV